MKQTSKILTAVLGLALPFGMACSKQTKAKQADHIVRNSVSYSKSSGSTKELSAQDQQRLKALLTNVGDKSEIALKRLDEKGVAVLLDPHLSAAQKDDNHCLHDVLTGVYDAKTKTLRIYDDGSDQNNLGIDAIKAFGKGLRFADTSLYAVETVCDSDIHNGGTRTYSPAYEKPYREELLEPSPK